MPLPIICTYERLQQYLLCYRDVFSKPQYKYFVIDPPFLIVDRACALNRSASVRLKKALASLSGGDLGKAKGACAVVPRSSHTANWGFWHMLASARLLVICRCQWIVPIPLTAD